MIDCKILVIDDDRDVLYTAQTVLKQHFSKVTTEDSPNAILSHLKKEPFDLILLDMNFTIGATSGKEGLYWLRKILSENPDAHVVMDTAYGDVKLAVEAMKLGAIDFLVKPWNQDDLIQSLVANFELSKGQKLSATSKTDQGRPQIISQSKEMGRVLQTVGKVAATEANVLVLGENGTGKELIARRIHEYSDRSTRPFITVDLGAIPESLFESELFGHIRGSFTDAKEDRPGRFESAHGGTLFLDEIGNISINNQAKLLSVLQTREVQRLGANHSQKIDVRLISATNTYLHNLVEQGNFRQDLLYRINTVEIEIPPLRARKEDILLLTNNFLDIYGRKYAKTLQPLAQPVLDELTRYSWPGNVRELQHVVERAVILSEKQELTLGDFLIRSRDPNVFETSDTGEADQPLNLEDLERSAIENAIKKSNGNLTVAAKILGVGRTTLYRKMAKYGL